MKNLNGMTEIELETYARRLLYDKDWEEIQRVLNFCEIKAESTNNYRYKILSKEITKLGDNIKSSK